MKSVSSSSRNETDLDSSLTVYADLKRVCRIAGFHWPLIATACAVGIGLAFAYLATTPKTFRATARLLLTPEGGRPLIIAQNVERAASPTPDREDFLPTQMALISSPLIVNRAIAALGPTVLPTIRASAQNREGELATQVIERIRVSRPDRMANIVGVSCDAGSAEEATRLVEAVVEAYRESLLRDMHQQGNSRLIEHILKAQAALKGEIDASERKYLDFRKAHPDLAATKEGRPLGELRLESWGRAANDAMVKAVRLRSQLEIARKLAGEGMALWAILHAMGELGGESGELLKLLGPGAAQGAGNDHLHQLALERERLVENFGPKYSKVVDLDQRIAQLRQRIEGPETRGSRNETADLIRAMERSLASVEALQTECEKRLSADQAEADSREINLLTEQSLRETLTHQRSLLNNLTDQLEQAQLTNDYDGASLQIIEPARSLAVPVHPKSGLTLAIGLAAGSCLGLAIALSTELFDDRTRTVAEIEDILKYEILGRIPCFKRDGPESLLGLRHEGDVTGAFRGLRANLELFRRDSGATVFLVTSLDPGESSCLVAAELAAGLTRSRRKILVVDADSRRPKIEMDHDVESDRCLVGALRNALPLSQVVRRSSPASFDVVLTGKVDEDFVDLVVGGEMNRIIQEARHEYDVVMIVASCLTSIESTIVLEHADATVFVLEGQRPRRGDLRRCRDVLQGSGRPVFGVVLESKSFKAAAASAQELPARQKEESGKELDEFERDASHRVGGLRRKSAEPPFGGSAPSLTA